ncbi:hypothetical protein HYW42_00805 [Candidatus Daviesbacteria bacterium]|nr:hypothetical protein [Candidatus Daviesbacteria bacterium]
MNDNQNKTFATDNFQLACYLVSEAIPLLSLDKTNPKRVVFILEESDKRRALTQKYLSYMAETEVHRIFSAQKDLKQMIYQNKSNL